MYDHVSFHLDEDYPADLPAHHAAHHIGYYYAWAVSQNLHSEAAASLPDFDKLQSGAISGAKFVLEQLNGGIDETCSTIWATASPAITTPMKTKATACLWKTISPRSALKTTACSTTPPTARKIKAF